MRPHPLKTFGTAGRSGIMGEAKGITPMSKATQKKMTMEEFFEWQQRQDRNYDLVDGVPVMTVKAMTGASRRHDRVTVSAIISLGTRLRGKPCDAATDKQSLANRGTRRFQKLEE